MSIRDLLGRLFKLYVTEPLPIENHLMKESLRHPIEHSIKWIKSINDQRARKPLRQDRERKMNFLFFEGGRRGGQQN